MSEPYPELFDEELVDWDEEDEGDSLLYSFLEDCE
jgi:hypothetical protein